MAENLELLFNGNIHEARKEQYEFEAGLNSDSKSSCKTKIIVEIYQSEVTYLLQLEILIIYFMYPLKNCSQLSKDEYQQLFGNILELYNVNKELLLAMKENPSCIAQAFKRIAPFFKSYSVYAHGYKNSLQILQKKEKWIGEIIKKQETRPEVGTKLISLLISPVQRVPRYRLLLQSLLEATLTTDKDYRSTNEALSVVEETAWHINFFMSEAESGEAMVRLAFRLGQAAEQILLPGRKLLKEGIVRKAVGRTFSSHRRYLALFSDSILICRGKNHGPLVIVQSLSLGDIKVDRVLGPVLFRITKVNGKEMLFYTSQTFSGDDWVSAIEDAIVKFKRMLLQNQDQNPSSIHRNRLLPMLMKGTESLRRALRKYKRVRDRMKPLKRCQDQATSNQ